MPLSFRTIYPHREEHPEICRFLLAQADVVIPEDEKRSRPPVKTDSAATTATTTTATTATQTAASQAPVPERRKSNFPFAAITTIGFVLIVALTARRRRASNTP